MNLRRINISDAAVADILEQADWYESKADYKLAERWENAVTAAMLRIAKAPGSGQLCFFRNSELRDVRRTFVTGFPKHLIFYRFTEEELLVLRIVHGARDLEKLF